MTRKSAAVRQTELLDRLVFMSTVGAYGCYAVLMQDKPADETAAGMKCPRVECCVKLLERLYSLLGVLDSKANGLLRVNSLNSVLGLLGTKIAATAAAVPANLPGFIALVAVVLFIISSVQCMMIVKVDWRFYEHVSELNTPNAHQGFRDEIIKLAEVADQRTISYRWAWWLTLAGYLPMVVAYMIASFPSVLGNMAQYLGIH